MADDNLRQDLVDQVREEQQKRPKLVRAPRPAGAAGAGSMDTRPPDTGLEPRAATTGATQTADADDGTGEPARNVAEGEGDGDAPRRRRRRRRTGTGRGGSEGGQESAGESGGAD